MSSISTAWLCNQVLKRQSFLYWTTWANRWQWQGNQETGNFQVPPCSVPEKATAPHSSPLSWTIPWTEEPGGLQSMGLLSRTGLSAFTFPFHFHAPEKAMATHSSVLAWRIPGTGEPGGLPSKGSHRVGQDWCDLAEQSRAAQCKKAWVWALQNTSSKLNLES